MAISSEVKWGLLLLGAAVLAAGGAVAIRFKDGVEAGELRPELLHIFRMVSRAYGSFGLVPTVTSLRDGTHKPGSLHYTDMAADFRMNDVAGNLREKITAQARALLGSAYDVVLHGEGANVHLHVEYDPKFL